MDELERLDELVARYEEQLDELVYTAQSLLHGIHLIKRYLKRLHNKLEGEKEGVEKVTQQQKKTLTSD